LKEEASLKGYTVVDAATVMSTHLTELLKNNMSDLLSYGEVQKLLKDLPKEQGELVKDIVPSQVTVSGIQRVLQLLLAERISIRDLSTILEGIADALAFSRNPATVVEHVRARLARQICAQNTSMNGYLPLVALSAMIGAITLSRIVTDPELSAAILEHTRKYLTARVAPPRRPQKSRGLPGRSANL